MLFFSQKGIKCYTNYCFKKNKLYKIKRIKQNKSSFWKNKTLILARCTIIENNKHSMKQGINVRVD